MSLDSNKKNKLLFAIVWILEGIVAGFGAILPGVSGGTLCVAFGMYKPIIETLSNVRTGLKKYWFMLGMFMFGVALGFVGLSGLTAWLLDKNTAAVTCVFVGFILGTLPELWRDAGVQGRSKSCYASALFCFVGMLVVLFLLKTNASLTIEPNMFGFLLCGVLWGLSFIVPGLSSSSLLLFFGLYQPMLAGISTIDFSVLIPMAVGMGACVLLLSQVVNLAYKKKYALISHGVIGIVIATLIMILPTNWSSAGAIAVNLICIAVGAVLSYLFGIGCDKIKEKAEK